ncbi:MAG: ribbon-helix-helix domain-containing protein [Candidatus Thermoplasmatota archaeon]
METVQIRLTKDMLKELDKLINSGEYPNRSEAIRDGVRRLIRDKKYYENDALKISVSDLQKFIREVGER